MTLAELADRIEQIAGKLAHALDGDADRQYAAEQTLADLDALVLDIRATP